MLLKNNQRAFRSGFAGSFESGYAADYAAEGGMNKFAHSSLDPWCGPAHIPDLDMTDSVLKSVLYPVNFRIPASGSGLFLFYPYAMTPTYNLTHWTFHAPSGQFLFSNLMPPSIDLREDFSRGRAVSGAVSIKSATISGAIFDVAGTINAIQFQQLPDVSTLTFQNLISFRNNETAVESSVPLADGVTGVIEPEGDYLYKQLETPDIVNLRDRKSVV